ncbi:hypothetical protein [Pseudoalteromonas gelatinilytica]
MNGKNEYKFRDKLRGRIQNFIRNIKIVNGEFDILDSVDKSRDLANFTSNWIAKPDYVESNHLYAYITWQLLSFVESESIESKIKGNNTGLLKDFIAREIIDDFENKLFLELSTIPHEYKITYQLEEETLLDEMSIPISENVEFLVSNSDNLKPITQSPSVFTDDKKKPNASYLVMKLKGFCCHDLNSSGIQEAISIIKVFLFSIWTSNKILNLENGSLNSKLNTFDRSIIMNKFLQIAHLDSSYNLIVTLPSDLTLLLNNFKFKDKDVTATHFSKIAKLLQSNSKGSKRIKSAIEWYIDSTFNKSDSVKFIQTCIGLESLLGDERQDAPLSYTLADRCAYLIATSFEDREKIRSSFREMYRVRSKLVHGTSRNITESEFKHYLSARHFLNEAISNELNNLNNS